MKPMASSEEIAWAAGLFEGEGCISHMQRGSGLDLQIALAMTDEEVVRRFDAVVDRGRVYGPYLPPSHGPRRTSSGDGSRAGTPHMTFSI
jgi:hypothetical protein